MADQLSRMVRRRDAKINAFSRLIDAGIIGCTLVALVSVLKLSWVPLYSWLLLIAIVLFSFLSESSHSYKAWRDISLKAEVTEMAPSVAIFHYHRGIGFSRLGKFKEAKKALLSAREQAAPDDSLHQSITDALENL